MAVVTGAKFFGANDNLGFFNREDLGHVDRFEFLDDVCFLVGGKGKEEKVKERVKEVEAEIKRTKHDPMKKDKMERLSALSRGYGVIKIGAATNDERNWLKYKIEDARGAVKHALKEGIVRGGGLTYKKIADSLPDDNVLKEALYAPYLKLKENAGGEFKVGKDVFDPVATEKAALFNACSAVSKLIRIGGAISYEEESSFENALKRLVNNKEDNYGE
jgi:chaperonin GroEL